MALWEFVRWDDNKNKARERACTPGLLGPNLSGGKNSKVIDISESVVIDLEDGEEAGGTDGGDSSEYRYYVWPDFILDLLNRPAAWAAWRKKTERDLMGGINSMNGRQSEGGTIDLAGGTVKFHRPVSRRVAYFTALCADREAELEEKAGDAVRS